MKNKLISLILCGIIAFSLVGCGDKEKKESNNVVSTDNDEVDKGNNESTESKDSLEYISMTKDEASKFNNENFPLMKKYLEGKGYEILLTDTDILSSAIYVGTGNENEYNSIGYSAEIENNKVVVRYVLTYYVDRGSIQDGTIEAPRARDLLVAEPYKIMTGDEISEELLDKIDEAIEYGCLNDNVDEVTLEENGPFKINVRVDGIDVTF